MRYNITNIEVALYEKGGEEIAKERIKNKEFIAFRFFAFRFFTKKGYIEWLPSLEVIAKYLQFKAGLEDKRYPNGEGRVMLARFINRAIKGEEITELLKEFEVPETRIPWRATTPQERDEARAREWSCPNCGEHNENDKCGRCQMPKAEAFKI